MNLIRRQDSDPLVHAFVRAQEGDFSAYKLIVELTSKRLVRAAARMLGDMNEAEDAVQDSYVRAFQTLKEDKMAPELNPEAWLYRIVINRCIDLIRTTSKRAKYLKSPENKPGNSSDGPSTKNWETQNQMEARVALKELQLWLSELPLDQKAALILVSIEGLSTAEAAKAMGCSEGAIEQRLMRAKKKLRQRRATS